MTRTERLLRLARIRGDRLAIATLETDLQWRARISMADRHLRMMLDQKMMTETELRALWGDR